MHLQLLLLQSVISDLCLDRHWSKVCLCSHHASNRCQTYLPLLPKATNESKCFFDCFGLVTVYSTK